MYLNTAQLCLYVIAFATSFLHEENPTKLKFTKQIMRPHFGE